MKKTTDNKKTKKESNKPQSEKELNPKQEAQYKTWLHSSSPFLFGKIYGGKK